MVHRLNIELSKFQSPESQDVNVSVNASALEHVCAEKSSTNPPPWLSEDLRYLAPLIIAYDEEIIEKNEVIEDYECEMAHIKSKYDDRKSD